MSQIFGPVPSRRLGLSLGIDIIPFKTCTFDCVYCQLGRTTNKTIQRKKYIASEEILRELEKVIREGKKIDYITFSGSGEPTLNLEIGKMIAGIKKMTSIPVAVLTNGTLLHQPQVQADLLEADLVVPSLDAASEEVFRRVNRPHSSLTIGGVIRGIKTFSRNFKGKLWLEIMLVKGMNDSEKSVNQIKKAIKEMRLDKIQLNTVVRPPAEEFAQGLSWQDLERIKSILGKRCEIVAELSKKLKQRAYKGDIEKTILTMVKRRPLTLAEISSSLGLHQNEVIKYIGLLEREGQIKRQIYREKRYYV